MSKLTVELTPEEIKVILIKHVATPGLIKPEDVEFVISNEWRGQGAGEHQIPVFKGARLTTFDKQVR